MSREKFILEIPNNTKIVGYRWYDDKLVSSEVKGTVMIAHGMAEHILRYEEFAEFLVANKYIVIGHHQFAHGESAGQPELVGICKNDFMTEVIEGMKLVYERMKKYFVGKCVLFSHSMGSMASQRYIELYPNDFHQVIFCGSDCPNLNYRLAEKIANREINKHGSLYNSPILKRFSMEAFNKRFRKEHPTLGWLSSNLETIQKYEIDPYCGKDFPVNYFYSLAKMMNTLWQKNEIMKVNREIKILVIAGKDDPVGHYGRNIKKLYKKFQTLQIDVKIILYPNARHELLNEKESIKKEVYKDIINYINY